MPGWGDLEESRMVPSLLGWPSCEMVMVICVIISGLI